MDELTTEPRVWVGCLACYNGGDLHGEWLDPESGPDWECGRVDLNGPHEETWVFDHEGLPISGECSPAEAARVAELLADIAADERPAFHAWLGMQGRDDLDDDIVAQFQDAYRGTHSSIAEYMYSIYEEEAASLPEWVQVDWEGMAWTEVSGGAFTPYAVGLGEQVGNRYDDMAHEFSGGVYIFYP